MEKVDIQTKILRISECEINKSDNLGCKYFDFNKMY